MTGYMAGCQNYRPFGGKLCDSAPDAWGNAATDTWDAKGAKTLKTFQMF